MENRNISLCEMTSSVSVTKNIAMEVSTHKNYRIHQSPNFIQKCSNSLCKDTKLYIEPKCKYCITPGLLNAAEWLTCIHCSETVHVACLKRLCTPGGLQGDVFFKFTCAECSTSGAELLVRDKMPWFQTIVLVLYHMQCKSSGTARNGFFHWKIHLVTFIEKNWDILFHRNFKRKKNWIGTIAGVLSHYSPHFFMSGIKHLGEAGWWRLTFPKLTPSVHVVINGELLLEKQKKCLLPDNITFVKQSLKKFIAFEDEFSDELLSRGPSLFDDMGDKGFMTDELVDVDLDDVGSCVLRFDCSIAEALERYDAAFTGRVNGTNGHVKIKQRLQEPVARESQVQKVQESLELSFKRKLSELKQDCTLFKNSTSSNFLTFWQKNMKKKNVMKQQIKTHVERLTPLHTEEESILLKHISKQSNCESNRLQRKLLLRAKRHQLKQEQFNVDMVLKTKKQKRPFSASRNMFSCYGNRNDIRIANGLSVRIVGKNPMVKDFSRISPYTGRILKPFIRRDHNMEVPWLKLMYEIHCKVGTDDTYSRSPLDFCYVMPNHIPVVNSLCGQFFWPGIDLSDALEYPDFTCVVLYRKLVVAFAFMVPDVKYNETYVSFIFTLPAWRRTGIATFMIYHLIQTCMGKDITLHVSVDNPAIFLYQKFGFKVEELVLNFYKCYMSDDEKQSKHAFFLRLER